MLLLGGCASSRDTYGNNLLSSFARPDPAPGNGERWIEVRSCYEFTSIFQLPLFSLGNFWLERTRTFTIPCYFATGYGGCG